MTVIVKAGWACAFAAGVLGLAVLAGGAAESLADDVADYTVIDGNVDPNTREGYTVYSRACMACHGPDGLGSSFAPSLIQAAERRSFEEFAQTIAEGREIQPGQVMPSFADDLYVMSNLVNVWSYLKARADGGLGRGRPGIIEDMQEDEES